MAGFVGSFGSAVLAQGVTEILKGLSILVAGEIALEWGVEDELQKLKKTLDMILAVMIDAEKKQVKSGAVRLWLQELKDIAYEAEDVMDEYAYEVMHQREMTRKRDKVINGRVAVPLITANLDSLESVELVEITELRFLPYRLLQDNNKVKVLKVIDCLDFQGFTSLPSEERGRGRGGGFTSLEVLSMVRLPALKFLPDIRSFTSLEELYIYDCESLKPIPEDLTCLPSSLEHLKEVEIRNVKEVEDFKWQK